MNRFQNLPDAQLYCRLMGSMGLSPYSKNELVTGWLDQAFSPGLPQNALIDICEAADANTIGNAVRTGATVIQRLDLAADSTLEGLSDIPVPNDNPAVPPWKWGLDCSKRVQTAMGISPYDVSGSMKFF